MDRVKLANEIATRAHKGQTDKLGADYISHPRRVHRNLTHNPKFKKLDALTREDLEVAALLHDVIEDSGTNGSERFEKQDLLDLGFSVRSIRLVELLTRVDGVEKKTYYIEINDDVLAKLVKWADIADNLNTNRVKGLDPLVKARLAQRYQDALEIIKMDEEDAAWLQSAIDYDIELEDVEDDAYEDEG
jgi:(p)ppGpp synthase/HD superfamily hydrolase